MNTPAAAARALVAGLCLGAALAQSAGELRVEHEWGVLGGACIALTWSPDGRHLAASGMNGEVNVLEVAHNRLVATISATQKYILATCFSPDGERLAVAGQDLSLWRRDGRLVGRYADASSGAIAFSRDGTWLAAITTQDVVLFDGDDLRESRRFRCAQPTPTALAFAPDGRVAIAEQNAVRIVDPRGPGVRDEFLPLPGVTALTYLGDGRLVTLRGAAAEIAVDGETRRVGGQGLSFAMTDDGKRGMAMTSDGLFAFDAGAPTRHLWSSTETKAVCVALHPDAMGWAQASWTDGAQPQAIGVWRAGSKERTLASPHRARLRDAMLVDRARYLRVREESGRVTWLDCATGAPLDPRGCIGASADIATDSRARMTNRSQVVEDVPDLHCAGSCGDEVAFYEPAPAQDGEVSGTLRFYRLMHRGNALVAAPSRSIALRHGSPDATWARIEEQGRFAVVGAHAFDLRAPARPIAVCRDAQSHLLPSPRGRVLQHKVFLDCFGGMGEACLVDADGAQSDVVFRTSAAFRDVAWSPDGSRVAFAGGVETTRVLDEALQPALSLEEGWNHVAWIDDATLLLASNRLTTYHLPTRSFGSSLPLAGFARQLSYDRERGIAAVRLDASVVLVSTRASRR